MSKQPKITKRPEIQSSKNYEWFQRFTNNRPIENAILKNLREQFQKYGNITAISPIAVNKNGFIYDGQHRELLCEEFGYEVFYIEVDMPFNITSDMNRAMRPWGMMNYIEFFAKYKPEYELLRRFISDNRTNYSIASAVIFSGSNRKWLSDRKLKEGELEVKPFLKKAQEHMDIVSEIGEKMGATFTEKYVRGIARCLDSEDFDLERFMRKLKTVMRSSPNLPNPRLTSLEDVMRNLESIYNYMSGDKERVRLY